MPSVQIMAVWLLIGLLCGYFVYLRFLAESDEWGRPTRFHGIRAISQELERIVERLATGDLPSVVDAALESIADDFADDADVQHAIATYRTDRPAARTLAKKLALKANLCDSAYIRLEEAGRKDESAANFRKMCVLNGLSPLLASETLTEKVADDLIYNLGHGARNADSFAQRMVAKLESSGKRRTAAG